MNQCIKIVKKKYNLAIDSFQFYLYNPISHDYSLVGIHTGIHTGNFLRIFPLIRGSLYLEETKQTYVMLPNHTYLYLKKNYTLAEKNQANSELHARYLSI